MGQGAEMVVKRVDAVGVPYVNCRLDDGWRQTPRKTAVVASVRYHQTPYTSLDQDAHMIRYLVPRSTN